MSDTPQRLCHDIVLVVNHYYQMKYQLPKTMLAFAALATIGAGAAVGALVSADSTTAGTATAAETRMGHFGGGIGGEVTAVSGTTITLTGRDNVSYTVDASGATVRTFTNGTPGTGSIADIAVGDKIGVRGTVSGTSVTATEIMDGLPPHDAGHGKGPGVRGTVSAISGNTLTITDAEGKTYTVDASNAKASKIVSVAVGDIAVGDSVGVMGSVSGTSVTAAHIMTGEIPVPNAPPLQ